MLRRCEMLFVADWNPKLTFHFLFNWEGRDNVMFTKTTFWDNKHLSSSVKNGILATCPYDFKDFDVETRTWLKPEEEREVNLVNKTNNTIDKWAWLVYGEGVRCPEDGVIFKDIEWIKEFPDNLEEVKFGLDFGYTCFDGSTLITTNKGYKKIKNIKKGDFVLTENGFHKVLSLNNNGVKHIVEKYIEFDFGYINIISTFDHLFKTNQGWKQLKDLQKGELLYLNVNTKEKYTEVTNLEKRKGISLMFQKIKNFIEKYGKMLMEKYKKAKRYIILMGIHIIMNCQILFKSLTLNIQKYIIVYLELYQNIHLQNKIGKKEELKRFLNYKAKKNNVSHVIKHLLLQIHIKYHAVLNVIINFNILILDLMKHIFAKFAAHLLKEINILNRKLALQYVHINCLEVKEINTIREYEDIVYDLTIDGYNSYFANDILVHNCDPSVLVKVGRSGFDLYLEYLTYQSCPSPDHLYDLVEPILTKEYEKRKLEAGKLDFEHVIVHCDSSDKYKDVEFVNSLNETKYVKGKDFDFIKTRKTGIVVGISAIKKFNLHIVDNGSEITKKSRIEFENYTTKIISGIQTNIPIDAFNHGIDAFRYVVVDNWIYLVR